MAGLFTASLHPSDIVAFKKNVAMIRSRWQCCVRLDQADLNLRPPTLETNALPLNQLALKEHNQKYRLNASKYKAQVDFLKTLSIICAPYDWKNMTFKSLVAPKKNKLCYSYVTRNLKLCS